MAAAFMLKTVRSDPVLRYKVSKDIICSMKKSIFLPKYHLFSIGIIFPIFLNILTSVSKTNYIFNLRNFDSESSDLIYI